MVIWGVLEFGIHTLRPDAIDREERIIERFNETSSVIWQRQNQLQIEAVNTAQRLTEFLNNDDVDKSLYKFLNDRPRTDIIAVYKNDELVVWSDGLTKELEELFTNSTDVIFSNQIGLYLIASSAIRIGADRWRVFNASKIYQIANPGSRFGDVYQPLDKTLRAINPAPFYIEGRLDMLPSDYRFNIIKLFDDETSGYIVLNVTDPVIRSYLHPNLDLAVRTILFSIIIVISTILVRLYFSDRPVWIKAPVYILYVWLVFGCIWGLNIALFVSQFLSNTAFNESIYEQTGLLSFIVWSSALVLSIIVLLASIWESKRYFGFTWYPRTILFSVGFGTLSGIAFGIFNSGIRFMARLEVVEIVDLSLIPNIPTLWVFLLSGFLGTSLILGTIYVAWFLMNSEKDQISWVHPLVVVGFVFSYIVSQNLTTEPIEGRLFEIIWMALFFTASYLVALRFHHNPEQMRFYSVLRVVILNALIIGVLTYPSFYTGVNEKYETAMRSLAEITLNPDAWRAGSGYTIQSPYLILVYEDNRITSLTGDFAAGQFPDNAALPPITQELRFNTQSIYHIEKGPHFKYRELVYQASPSKFVVIQTRLQNFHNYVYSFFRYYLYLIIVSFFLMFLYEYLAHRRWLFVRSRESFQHRIQDTYLLSSFLFLLMLIVATQEIIKSQNLKNIELEVVENLDLLQLGIQSSGELATREDLFLGFDYLYFNLSGTPVTTEPELAYSIGLSGILPFNIYSDFMNNRSQRHLVWSKAFNENILIGYRAVQTGSVIPTSAVAIPVLPSAKKYVDQILQTVSFLLLLYIIIFGLFLFGGILISREIMRPIHQFRKGLQSIASGQLDSTIPVTTQDEIGELANSYNLMVFKLKDLQEELAESERQNAWTEMARQVAHEIKNPLTPMKLSIQHLYQQVEYGNKTIDEVRPLVRNISNTLVHEIESLSNIAADFSKFARPIMEEFMDADLNALIHDIIDLYKHDKRIQLYFDPSPEPVEVHIAVDEIKRVIINLIKNATEAVGTTGMILIRTYSHEKHGYMEVIDNGIGMTEQVKERIFIPNFSTKNTGTGLGLAICKKVIDAHSGSIRFATALNIGTTFTVTLPLKEQ